MDPPQPGSPRSGTVYLVGAGPGDPGLITLRGAELLQSADLILYDNLTSADVLALARPDAERLYVGKKRAKHTYTQGEINGLMIRAARDGRSVVRLKGGDPCVFGRGGEEARAMSDSGVPFEVVPGVTSALGVAAYAGMPLTHRDHTRVVTMLTGHDIDSIDWNLMAGRQTLVIFMGLMSLQEIARRLINAGLDSETPSAAVRWVTRGDQQVVTGPLGDLPAEVAAVGLKPPALVVIGEIVRLREEIDWFDKLPLRGQSVVVTRAASQSRPFCEQLRRLGANVIAIPTIEFEEPLDWGPADAAIRNLSDYAFLVFTSVNGVDRFLARLDASQHDLRDLPNRICAIGPATENRLQQLHLRVDVLPEEFVAESLVEALANLGMNGSRVLLPRAQDARELLPVKLAELGANVDVVPVYRTVLPESSRILVEEAWRPDRAPDWVTVTSSSTVRNLAELVPASDLRRSKLASIGPVTSGTAHELGLQVLAEASPFTTEGLAQALCAAVHCSFAPDA